MPEIEKLIGDVNNNVFVRATTFKGNKYVDIRKFTGYSTKGMVYPTAKGISIPLDNLSKLIDLLEIVEEKKQKGVLFNAEVSV